MVLTMSQEADLGFETGPLLMTPDPTAHRPGTMSEHIDNLDYLTFGQFGVMVLDLLSVRALPGDSYLRTAPFEAVGVHVHLEHGTTEDVVSVKLFGGP